MKLGPGEVGVKQTDFAFGVPVSFDRFSQLVIEQTLPSTIHKLR